MKKSKYYQVIRDQRIHKEIDRMFNYYSREPEIAHSNTKKTLDDYENNSEIKGISNENLLQDSRS